MSVEYQLDGDVAIITLNRPDRFNAIEAVLAAGVVEAVDTAGREARTVVLTGAGKAFCSGADLSQLIDGYDNGGPDLAGLLNDVFHPMVLALVNSKVPTVAAINGVAAGAGLGVALGCDIRIMAESAFLTSAFTAIGLVPDSIGLLLDSAKVDDSNMASHFDDRCGSEAQTQGRICRTTKRSAYCAMPA